MNAASPIDTRDSHASAKGGIVLGEDWEETGFEADPELRPRRRRSGIVSLNRSPLARKIITFNLIAPIILIAGVLFLNPFRDGLVQQREEALIGQGRLLTGVIEAQLPAFGPVEMAAGDGVNVASLIAAAHLREGETVSVYDTTGARLAQKTGRVTPAAEDGGPRETVIIDFLSSVWDGLSGLLAGNRGATPPKPNISGLSGALAAQAASEGVQISAQQQTSAGTVFAVATPIRHNGKVLGAVVTTSAGGEIDRLVNHEREQVLRMFVIAILVSVGLSLVLASTIANPLSDLAAAAELGRDRQARKMAPSRVRIPDLTARPDEIGRLSVAMRGMVSALYDRIDANEQFAADVAHEIKNPLASLRSAVASMRVAKREDQRDKLLSVIDHDVRRLDRLVSEISNASRLDSELVKDEEEPFNLLKMLHNLSEYLGKDAATKGVDFISDLPAEPIVIHGLEERLAQVFVNLITNAISFCEEGDAVRVWARRRDNRVLVVVEDTGPGIPEEALSKIFKRFYSERPAGQFGDHSGLGLSISKQIVEAHGGVIWAENIRPTDADPTSQPLGARFVVGLPI